MTIVEEIHEVLVRVENHYNLPLEDLTFLMSRKTYEEILRDTLRLTVPSGLCLTGEKQMFGIPVIVSSDIKEGFSIAMVLCRATEKGGAE